MILQNHAGPSAKGLLAFFANIAICLGFSSLSGAAVAIDESGNCTLILQIPPEGFRIDASRKTITVVTSNISQSDRVVVRLSNPMNDFDVIITTSAGEIVPMTTQGAAAVESNRASIFRNVRRILMPGESVREEIDLQSYYALEEGDYTVSVRRRFTDRLTSCSNVPWVKGRMRVKAKVA